MIVLFFRLCVGCIFVHGIVARSMQNVTDDHESILLLRSEIQRLNDKIENLSSIVQSGTIHTYYVFNSVFVYHNNRVLFHISSNFDFFHWCRHDGHVSCINLR